MFAQSTLVRGYISCSPWVPVASTRSLSTIFTHSRSLPQNIDSAKNLHTQSCCRNRQTSLPKHLLEHKTISVPCPHKRGYHDITRISTGLSDGYIKSSLLLSCSTVSRSSVSRHVSNVYGISSVRHNSTTPPPPGTEAVKEGGSGFLAPPSDYIPEPPPIPEIIEPIAPLLNALGEPTFASLGLGSWWPKGLVQCALEMVHVDLGLPWWGAIALATVTIRCLMFPLVIKSQKNSAKMHNHMPHIQNLQARFTDAKNQGNALDAARYGNEMTEYMKKHDVKILRNFLVPAAQVPVFLSMFTALRGMANLPVESFKTGGLFWFMDLSVPDPTWVLPFITMATFLVTIEVGVDTGMKLGSSQSMNVKWIMRAIPIITLPIVINFPTAMLCYWVTSNSFSLVQVLVLKIPGLREKLGIEKPIKHDKSLSPPKKGIFKGFKDSWDNAKVQNLVKEREQMNAKAFERAGTAPIPKTYKYDPTKTRLAQPGKASEQLKLK